MVHNAAQLQQQSKPINPFHQTLQTHFPSRHPSSQSSIPSPLSHWPFTPHRIYTKLPTPDTTVTTLHDWTEIEGSAVQIALSCAGGKEEIKGKREIKKGNGDLQEAVAENQRQQTDESRRIDAQRVHLPALLGHYLILPLEPPGLLLRPPRHPEQAFPEHAGHHPSALFWVTGSLFRSIPSSVAGPRKLDPAPLWLQARLHVGTVSVRRRSAGRLALYPASVFRRVLRRHLHYREWIGFARDGCESLHHCLRPTPLRRTAHQHIASLQRRRHRRRARPRLLRLLPQDRRRHQVADERAMGLPRHRMFLLPARRRLLLQPDPRNHRRGHGLPGRGDAR
ncbi:hypothetical protein M8818_001908 [Zalaria obscura]|uniref:Uncharacterized protein n=1 Tax=Zalaria obscura TaxID=2024903 RepID=A0ACC3SIW7_9PEZI